MTAFKTSTLLVASHDVITSSQIRGSNRGGFFTLGDGCWLPKKLFFAQTSMVFGTDVNDPEGS